jgi:hypothetical protein
MGRMGRAFAKENQRRRLEERLQIFQCMVQSGGWAKHSRMSHHAEELIDAGPWDGPGIMSFGKLPQQPARRGMSRQLLTSGVNQQIGIEPDQLPPLHQIEQSLPILEINSRLELSLFGSPAQTVTALIRPRWSKKPPQRRLDDAP